jgi:hypothetical protein
MTLPNHFSSHADRHDAYRPTYPGALFGYLAPAYDLARNCAPRRGATQASRTRFPGRFASESG